jgi:hypothetical protein
MSDRIDDALSGEDGGSRLRVVVPHAILEISGTEVADGASDDLMLRLVPFDVVERYRNAYRRCGGWNP